MHPERPQEAGPGTYPLCAAEPPGPASWPQPTFPESPVPSLTYKPSPAWAVLPAAALAGGWQGHLVAAGTTFSQDFTVASLVLGGIPDVGITLALLLGERSIKKQLAVKPGTGGEGAGLVERRQSDGLYTVKGQDRQRGHFMVRVCPGQP